MSDIIDDIDALVDDQMAGGEPRSGFDYGDPTYPKCPHCERHWHGLPLTERVAAMYLAGHFDEDYRVDQDDSPVLCEGSEFIGPMRAPRRPSRWSFGGQQWLSIMAVPEDERIDWAAWFSMYLGWPDMYMPVPDDDPPLVTFTRPRRGHDLDTVQFDEDTGIYTLTIVGSAFTITSPRHHENRLLPLRLEDV